ncbi:MAG: autotransporter domain-containing protein [Verrucomicrobia bacterium]|nr:autotransporter domain-containing protein [Verrucomicrobiota bacterium]
MNPNHEFSNMELSKCGRRKDSKNLVWLLAAVAGTCIWASRPCDGQIEVDAYISNGNSNTVSVIDTETNTVIGSLAVGSAPAGVAVTPDGRYAYVANNGSNTISIIDTATDTVLGSSITLGSQAAGIAITPDGRYAYVTNSSIQGFAGDTVSVINTATNTVLGAPIAVGSGALGVAITPDGKYAYVANNGSNTVSIISTATNRVVGSPIPVGNSPVGVAVTPNGQYVFVTNNSDNTVSVISTATHAVVAAIRVGNDPAGIVITPNGRFAYVANNGSGVNNSNTVSVIDTATDTVVGSVTVGNKPLGIDVTPDGRYVYVTNSNDGTVSVINTATNTVVGSPIAVGSFPIAFGFFVGPNIIVARGGPLSVANDAALTSLGFGRFVDFNGGTLKTSGNLSSSRTISLLAKGGTIDTNGFNATLSGNIINSGALTKIGAGTLNLGGNNTYTGGTNIVGGVLSVSSDNNLGTGGIAISNNAELLTTGALFASTKTITLGTGGGTIASATGTTAAYASVFSGFGRLNIGDPVNTGTIILSGLNTYSGGTALNSGTLVVNGPQALGVGDVEVNGGILRADPQPIKVKGNYTQNAGGTLQLQVAGANPGQYDSLNVAGNAVLGGTLQLISLGFQPKAGNQLTLVSTGGLVSGRFAQFLDPFATGQGFNTVDLIYGRNSVVLEFLNLTAPITPPVPPPITPPITPPTAPPVIVTINFASFALTPNQLAAANLLDEIQLNPKAGDLISLLYKEPFSDLPADLEKISPDGLTAFYEISFSNANIQRLNVEGRLDDVRRGSSGFSSNMKLNGGTVHLEDEATVDGKSAKSPVEQALQPGPENRWGLWVTGFGDFVNVDGDFNARGYDFTTGGVTVGADYRINDQLAIGAMGEYAHTWTSLKPSGDIDVDSGRGGVYASWFNHGIYLNGAIYGGHNVYSSSRPTLGGMASGGTGGAELSTFISGGYEFHVGHLTVGPIAALQYTYVNIDSFSEKGSLAPFDIHSQSAESLRSDIGLRAYYTWQIGKVLVEPSLRAAWEHEYKYSDLPITAGFAGIPGPSATFYGPSEGHDSAIVSAGVSVQWTGAIATYVNYDGQLGRDRYDSNAVTGGLRISF